MGTSAIALTNPGSTTTNYPLRVHQYFAPGVIANYPQIVFGGVAQTTQVSGVRRHSDGSVQQAVCKALIASITGGATVSITFQNQASTTTTALTQAQMLAAGFDYDSTISITNGTTESASSRAMLTAGAYTVVESGPIGQLIKLADHTTKLYDLGWGTYKSFRPVFWAEFWPTINKVQVYEQGFVGDTEKLQDLTYSMTIRRGNASPATVYGAGVQTHHIGQMWIRQGWIGGAPPVMNFKYDITYLADLGVIPQYDTTVTISGGQVAAQYSAWINANRDILSTANWSSYMPGTGGSEALAPLHAQDVRALMSGDYRLIEQMCRSHEYAGYWGLHYIEGNSTKFYDGASVPAIGRPLTTHSRPTLWISEQNNNFNDSSTATTDRLTIVGARAGGDWMSMDHAHQPAWGVGPFIFTGHPIYLEISLFWVSWNLFERPPVARGPSATRGAITVDQVRGNAWGLRNRQWVVFNLPTSDPSYTLFASHLNDAYACWEGMRGITNGSFNATAMWTWGATTWRSARYGSRGLPPLKHFHEGWSGYVSADYFNNAASDGLAPWQENFFLTTLRWGQKMGHASGGIFAHYAQWLIGFFTSGASPYVAGLYQLPAVAGTSPRGGAVTGQYMQTYSQIEAAIQISPSASWAGQSDLQGSYKYICKMAAAACRDQPGGDVAWNFCNTNAHVGVSWSDNPQFAQVPYTSTVAGTPPTITRLTLNNGTVGSAYSDTMTATGDATITYSVVAGALPTGVSMNSSGVFSGTPTIAATSNFTIRATNSAGFAEQAYAVPIAEPAAAGRVAWHANIRPTMEGYVPLATKLAALVSELGSNPKFRVFRSGTLLGEGLLGTLATQSTDKIRFVGNTVKGAVTALATISSSTDTIVFTTSANVVVAGPLVVYGSGETTPDPTVTAYWQVDRNFTLVTQRITLGNIDVIMPNTQPAVTNSPPVWGTVPTITFTQGVASNFSYAGYVSDPDGNPITVTKNATALPTGVTHDGANKRFVYDGAGGTATTTGHILTASDTGGTAPAAFSTTFATNETPVGSPWVGPAAAGFTTCIAASGRAYGTNGVTNTYDDSYAHLTGFAANHEVIATIYRGGSVPAFNHEVEVHVRMSDSSVTNVVKSYEVLVNKDGNWQIMKWNGTYAGPPDFFYELASGNLSGAPANGDQMRVRAVTSGSNCVITFWYRLASTGVESQVVTVTDDGSIGGAVHTTGQPGMAFFYRPGATNSAFGFDAFSASDL